MGERRVFHCGDGVGLAILDRHGGLMPIESQLGKGSVFTICLPA